MLELRLCTQYKLASFSVLICKVLYFILLTMAHQSRICLSLLVSCSTRVSQQQMLPSSLAALTSQFHTGRCHHAAELASHSRQVNSKYRVVIVGGGSGGCSVAAKLSSKLGKQCAVIEPNQTHYYQPLWTLVGGGLKTFESSAKPMNKVLPSKVTWIQERAVKFDPNSNSVELESGNRVEYEFLLVAMGLQLDYNKVDGLQDALKNDPMVVSNYHPQWVTKTFPALQQFKGGNAIFTFPNTPIKCAGAPQKIMYLAEEIFRKKKVRADTKVIYNTSLGVIFGVKKYADALQKVVKSRDIQVNYKHNLVAVDHKNRKATFAKLEEDNKLVPFEYNFMHVAPPMSSPDVLKSSPLANEAGFVDINKHTLQHVKYPNIFGIGDCTSLPTAKTAAAVASQCGIVHRNLVSVMRGDCVTPLYDGYTSCPLITSSQKCILAEFDYNAAPLETLPINQGVERRVSYALKAHAMPELYWNAMLKGHWNGPSTVRKVLHMGMDKSPKIQA